MEHNKQLDGLIGPEESQRILGALQRGASRRDVLAMMMAGGMQAALAGSIASVAGTAHAQTPRKGGRIKVAGATAAVSDTLDPAKQVQPHRLHPRLACSTTGSRRWTAP